MRTKILTIWGSSKKEKMHNGFLEGRYLTRWNNGKIMTDLNCKKDFAKERMLVFLSNIIF